MCGIAGIAGDLPEERAASALSSMVEAQLHRGPDDGGIEIFREGTNRVVLGKYEACDSESQDSSFSVFKPVRI